MRGATPTQDPHQADKLAKIQSDLDETKVVLHRTIESMLERGEKLDTLVGKSEDLSMASQMFYKQVRGLPRPRWLHVTLQASGLESGAAASYRLDTAQFVGTRRLGKLTPAAS